MKHSGRDPKQALVEQELLSWFENEVVDEDLAGFQLTRVELSADRSHVTLWILPPDATEWEANQEETLVGPAAEAALAAQRWEVQDRVEEILRKRPDVRWREDRGAENKRRVESILEELRREPGKDG